MHTDVMNPESPLRKWLHWVTFIGVLINILGMALPFILQPLWYLEFFKLPGGGASTLWMRQAGLLLLFISLLYIPGGRDPFRYKWNGIAAIVVRFTIGSYWLYLVYCEGRTTAFVKFGLLDVVYAIFNGIFLWKVLTSPRPQ
jgi:hypothetical protein